MAKAGTDDAAAVDIYTVLGTLPGDSLFTPAAQSGCPTTGG